MTKTIVQQVKFKAKPERLYDLYMDSKLHSESTGGSAKLSTKVGGPFSAWDGYITGKNLALFPKRALVQSWRAADWDDGDEDSIFTLSFDKAPGGALVTMVHANVPDGTYTDLKQGWVDNYWNPWKAYLREK